MATHYVVRETGDRPEDQQFYAGSVGLTAYWHDRLQGACLLPSLDIARQVRDEFVEEAGQAGDASAQPATATESMA